MLISKNCVVAAIVVEWRWVYCCCVWGGSSNCWILSSRTRSSRVIIFNVSSCPLALASLFCLDSHQTPIDVSAPCKRREKKSSCKLATWTCDDDDNFPCFFSLLLPALFFKRIKRKLKTSFVFPVNSNSPPHIHTHQRPCTVFFSSSTTQTSYKRSHERFIIRNFPFPFYDDVDAIANNFRFMWST